MSRSISRRLVAQLPSVRISATSHRVRWLSTTPVTSTPEGGDPTTPAATQPQKRSSTGSLLESLYGTAAQNTQPSQQQQQQQQQQASSAMSDLSNSSLFQNLGKSSLDTSSLFGGGGGAGLAGTTPTTPLKEDDLEPYHLHIFAHKHNTHVTCTKPNRDCIISMSTGQVGFRKGKRKGFDSAYSLTKYVLERLLHTGWPPKMNRLELVLRGHGRGREGALKVLMSPEGKMLREKIVRVSDSTRVKFGGTRGQRAKRR